MLQLKNLYGAQTPIGIISTYNEWMICFLSESYDYVTSNEEIFIQPAKSKSPPAEEGKTILFTSKVYTYNSNEVVEVSASAIYKMYHSKVDPPVSLTKSNDDSETRKFSLVNNDGLKWTSLPCKLTLLT